MILKWGQKYSGTVEIGAPSDAERRPQMSWGLRHFVFGRVIESMVGSQRLDGHEMDHSGVLGRELNGYVFCSAQWSHLMTSRWSSSIFKTPIVHKGKLW